VLQTSPTGNGVVIRQRDDVETLFIGATQEINRADVGVLVID
jgi:hypothetical protein